MRYEPRSSRSMWPPLYTKNKVGATRHTRGDFVGADAGEGRQHGKRARVLYLSTLCDPAGGIGGWVQDSRSLGAAVERRRGRCGVETAGRTRLSDEVLRGWGDMVKRSNQYR